MIPEHFIITGTWWKKCNRRTDRETDRSLLRVAWSQLFLKDMISQSYRYSMLIRSHAICGWGLGAFLRWWPPSAMWADPLIFLWRGCLNNPIFSNFGLCAACWAHFMYHHELWPTSVGHPFSFLNSFWGLTGEKHYQKITIHIFKLVLQNFAIPSYFPYILFYGYLSPYFLRVGLLLQYMALFQLGN